MFEYIEEKPCKSRKSRSATFWGTNWLCGFGWYNWIWMKWC